jgi:hypothetical protein
VVLCTPYRKAKRLRMKASPKYAKKDRNEEIKNEQTDRNALKVEN